MAASQSDATRRRRRDSMDEPPSVSDFRLVLVGKTGSGRSSTGNTILGREAFKAAAGPLSVTSECAKQQEKVCDRMVTIIDTPGLFDTFQDNDTVKREISKCINMSAPGPHAILLAIRSGMFSAEDKDTVRKVEEIFGKDAWKYTIILFTHGDRVKSDFEQMVKEAGPELQEVLEKVGHRYHIFNNLKANDRGQVLDLLRKVEKMVSANGGQCYSNPTYLEVVKMLDQRESELREFYKEKLEEEIKAVESKYEKKLREDQQERQKLEEEIKAVESKYEKLRETQEERQKLEEEIKAVESKYEEKLRKTQEERQKLEEERKAVESKYKEKLREDQQEQQEVKIQFQSELEEVKRYFHVLVRGVRYVVEQTVPTDFFSVHNFMRP